MAILMDIGMDCKVDGAMVLMLGLKKHGGSFERDDCSRVRDLMLQSQQYALTVWPAIQLYIYHN
jgi:hypothetical protein